MMLLGLLYVGRGLKSKSNPFDFIMYSDITHYQIQKEVRGKIGILVKNCFILSVWNFDSLHGITHVIM